MYSEKDYPVYERLLYAELISDDLSNENLLTDTYVEAELPQDPIREFENSLTVAQKGFYDALVTASDQHVPTKLEVLTNPTGALVINY